MNQQSRSPALRSGQNSESNRPLAHIQRALAAIDSIADLVWLRIGQRVAGALLGGYAFSAALVALLTVALARAGLPRSEAVVSASLLGFGVYLLVLLWAFSVPSLLRLWAWLACATALTGGLLALLR